TPAHVLVGAGDGVERVVARGGVALGARRGGRDVIRRLGRGRQQVGRERGRGHVAVAAVARGRVRSEIAVRTRVRSGGGRTREHPEVGGGLVAARTGEAATGHGGVTGGRQRRGGEVRGTVFEAP